MTHKHWQHLTVLALSVGLVGCMVSKPLATVGTPSRVDDNRPVNPAGMGSVEVNVLWPDRDPGYSTQAIPNRAAYAVVTLTTAAGSAPVDINGRTIAPITIQRGSLGQPPYYGPGTSPAPGPSGAPLPNPSGSPGIASPGPNPSGSPASASPAPNPSGSPAATHYRAVRDVAASGSLPPSPTPGGSSGSIPGGLTGPLASPGPNGANVLDWMLPPQAGLNVKAELFDSASHSIGVATQTIDVVAGYQSVVSLDIVVNNAPVINNLSASTFKIGDTITITGANFGLSHPDWQQAQVFLTTQGNYSWGSFGGPNNYQYYNQVTLPSSAVTIASDSQIVVTVPKYLNYGWQFIDSLWNYFHAPNPQQLYLGVRVDGINSPLVPVTIPRTASESVSVTLQQGSDAPAHQTTGTSSIDVTQAPYSVPTATGSQWTYAITDTNGDFGFNSRTAVVTLLGGYQASVTYGGTGGGYWPGGNIDLRWDWQWNLLRTVTAPVGSAISVLPDEAVTMPDGTTATAKHLSFSPQVGPNSSDVHDVWYVPGVGPVRIRATQLYKSNIPPGLPPGANWPLYNHQVHDFKLLSFGVATGSAPAGGPAH
jgi:hypothetical protein